MYIPTTVLAQGGTGGLTSISDTTLAVDTANFDIQGIPGTYRALLLLTTLRSTRVANDDSARVRFNNDTGANYDYQYFFGQNAGAASASSAGSFAQTGLDIYTIPAASATAGAAGHSETWLPHYADTVFHKQILTRAGGPTVTSGAGYFSEAVAGRWRDTSAITRIQLICNTGSFLAGSRLTILGV